MAQLLVDVTPFKSVLRESKEKPGTFEVEGVMQRAKAENQNGRVYSKAILEREAKKYVNEFVDRGRNPGGSGTGTKFRDAIDTWVRQRIGTFPGLTFQQTSFLVRRSVWNKGIGGINFINNAIDNIIDDMIERGEDEYAEQFEEFIDEKLLVLSKSSRDITYNQ